MYQKRRVATLIANISCHLGLIYAYYLLKRRITEYHVVVLTYHRVGNPDELPWNFPYVRTQDFEHQVRYLCQEYDILPLDTLVRHIHEKDSWPRRAAIITFDDGYKNNFTYAYPILRKYNVPATINLTTAHIGTGNLFWFDKVKFCLWHTKHKVIQLDKLGTYHIKSNNDRMRTASRINEKLKKLTEKEKNLIIDDLTNALDVDIPPDLGKALILSWDEVRAMRDAGISFGAHSLNHPNLTKLPVEQVKREIVQSKIEIEERLGQDITVFCYPNGAFNAKISELVKEAGFHYALTSIPRMVDLKTNPYEFGGIPGGWNLNTLKLFSSGAYSDADTLLRRMKVKI